MADDFSANSSTTGSLTVNQYTTARIDGYNDQDWFAVTMTADTKYRVDVDSDVSDPFWDPHLFGIYDSTGTLISGTTNYNGGVGRDARKWFTATTDGTYYIAAGANARSSWGPSDNYRVRVADDWDDYSADVPTTASVTVDGDALEAEIDESIDTDWIAVTLEAGQQVLFDVTGNTSTYYSGGTFNTDVKIDGLYDNSGAMIAGTTVSNTGTTHETLTYTATTAGTYYLAVSGEGTASEGKYQVAVRGDDLSAGTDTTGIVTSAGGVLGDQPMRARGGEIFEGGDEDWIATPLLAGETYEIEVTGQGGLDPRLTGLFDPSGTLIAGTSASGSGDCATIYYTPTVDGTYFTGIAGEASTDSGNFTLRVWRDELTVDTTTTGSVVPGGAFDGRILANGDQDWISISMNAGQRYEVTVTGQSGFADPRLTGLYDSTGTMIYGTANSGTGNSAMTTYTAMAAGTYYIGVAGETAADGGNYRVSVLTDDYSADTSTTGVLVADGAAVAGELEKQADHDWFALSVTAGTTYHVSMAGGQWNSGRLYYTELTLRDGAGAGVLPGYYDGGGYGTGPADLWFTATADGTYFVDAHSHDNHNSSSHRGIYDLSVVTVADDFTAATDTTGTVAVNGNATGAVDFRGDKDWFAVTLEAGESYRIELEGYGAGANSGVRYPGIAGVYDATGTVIAGTGADGGYSGYPAQTAFTATADTTYYISAGSRYGSYTGDYELSVTQLVTLEGTGGNDWMGLPSTLGIGLFAINGGTGTDMMSFSGLGAGVFINLHSDQASSTDFNLIMDSIENVSGTSHDDVFHGSDRSEKMRGLGGRDMFYGSDGERDTIDGGSSTDTLSYQYSSEAVSVSLLRGRGNGGDAHGDRISNIENLIGSNHDDMIWGDGGSNRLEGGLGDDTLIGNGGDDYILAGLGTDVIVFSGNQSEYTITRDGISTTVDHTGGTGLDGTDLIGHAEVLRFADGDFLLS
ncbi:pre-peptidase C-terminal domain-containing protein (plasmid) [Shimia sp. W99]